MYASGQYTVAAIAEALASVVPPSIGTSLATGADPTCPSGAGMLEESHMPLTSCMPYTDLRAYYDGLRLSACQYRCPLGTVIDRC